MKVIGAGLGRTGTLSLKYALEELGFGPCYHMREVMPRPAHVVRWQAVAEGKLPDWDAIFAGYRATVDWPASRYYRELMAHYPEAKVVLTVRDPDRWYESALTTIYRLDDVMPSWVRWLLPPARRIYEMTQAVIWQGTFNGRFTDRQQAIDIYNRHNDEVRRLVPPERLLVYQVKDGWEPLCAFLGVPVPEKRPFPRVNDRVSMQRFMWQAQLAFQAGPLLVLALFCFWLLRRWRQT
jgi:hypothetical protein